MKNWKNRLGIVMMGMAVLNRLDNPEEAHLYLILLFAMGAINFIVEWES